MAARLETVPWFSIRRGLALVALVLQILVLVVPGVPDWLQAVVIILLCIALLV